MNMCYICEVRTLVDLECGSELVKQVRAASHLHMLQAWPVFTAECAHWSLIPDVEQLQSCC